MPDASGKQGRPTTLTDGTLVPSLLMISASGAPDDVGEEANRDDLELTGVAGTIYFF